MAVNCSTCGIPGAGRFCAECGTSLVGHLGSDEAVVFGAVGPAVAEESDHLKTGSPRRTMVIGLLLVGLLGLGALSLLRSSDPAPAEAVDEVADEVGGEDAPQKTTISTTVEPTTTRAPATTSTTEPNDEEPAGPLLGEPVPWFVVLDSQQGIVRIDITTGAIDRLGIKGSLKGSAWSHLIVETPDDGLVLIPFEDITSAEPEIEDDPDLPYQRSDSYIASSSRQDRFWSIEDRVATAIEYDISGTEVRRKTIGNTGPFSDNATPSFATPLAGGVFELGNDSSYRRIGEGRVVVENELGLLINLCDDSMTCGYEWRDPNTFAPIDGLLVPEYRLEGWFGWGQIGPGKFIPIGYPSPALFDPLTGETFSLRSEEFDQLWGRSIAVSADASVVAKVIGNRLLLRLVTDSGVGEIVEVKVRFGGGAPPVFIAKPSD